MRAWQESFEAIVREQGSASAQQVLARLTARAQALGLALPAHFNRPYVNTIGIEAQPPYPGDREIERRIKNIIRWNAMAMVVHANKDHPGIGGHISTYASVATLFEVGFHHFFHAAHDGMPGDQVYFQGHASPGVYARAYLEGRLTGGQILNFRRELSGGVPSYPHPWLMPAFWQFPTVSMGLSPICSIYQARFNRYLRARGLAEPDDGHSCDSALHPGNECVRIDTRRRQWRGIPYADPRWGELPARQRRRWQWR